MPRENWIWMGHPGHSRASERCKFFLCTYVNGYLISTIGEYWPDSAIRRCNNKDMEIDKLRGDAFDVAYFKKYGYEDVGYNRKYESKVFIAGKRVCDEDDEECCPYVQADCDGLVSIGYNTPSEALNGHYTLCEKWDKKPNPSLVETAKDWADTHENISALLEKGIIEKYEYDELRQKLIRKYCRDGEE